MEVKIKVIVIQIGDDCISMDLDAARELLQVLKDALEPEPEIVVKEVIKYDIPPRSKHWPWPGPLWASGVNPPEVPPGKSKWWEANCESGTMYIRPK